jgi:hypothetical protein
VIDELLALKIGADDFIRKPFSHGTAAETATPQQVHFRLHNDDELVAKP